MTNYLCRYLRMAELYRLAENSRGMYDAVVAELVIEGYYFEANDTGRRLEFILA